MVRVTASWEKDMSFDSLVSGHHLVMDSSTEHGGNDRGPRPKEVVLSALCGCTGMDVVSILGKMRVQPDSFRIVAEAESAEEHPR